MDILDLRDWNDHWIRRRVGVWHEVRFRSATARGPRLAIRYSSCGRVFDPYEFVYAWGIKRGQMVVSSHKPRRNLCAICKRFAAHEARKKEAQGE